MPRFRLLAGFLLALLTLTATAARAEDFPSRTIRVIVGFAAGGGIDLFARLVVQKLAEQTGWTVIVENKPGAGGRLSSEYVAKQPPDGYTVLVGATGQMSIATAVIHNITYNAVTSFTPLNMIASFPLILVVPANHPANNVKELVAWAKAHPDKSNYATSSPSFTIASELLKLKTGMPAVAIPFKGSNESNTCVLSEQCLFAIVDGPPSIPLVLAGKTKALAVTGAERSPLLPNVPSMAEAGFPDVNTKLFSGFFVPAGTPQPIVDKLTTALGKALADAHVQEGLKKMAVDPGGPTGEAFRKYIVKDIETIKAVADAAHLKFD
ncbi:MAG TPA: tripartite tricarboxylate transporter substrate binding protein [Sphingomicrobium sp.]|nr:tripartite tricarboxylate transporter substrate binding protein [Sphingomicrobium sp.]